MTVILYVTLSATGAFEHARIYPVRFTGQGQPVPRPDVLVVAQEECS